ncbi:MAG: MBL fold metallo-hydrolase [Clostridia bacterium]|nr:MBL fold metallo-hydrolase [Clostridia bacterium]
MYELIQVAENTFYIESPAKIGLVRLNDTDVCLIDSGSDKDAGRKVRQILDRNGWNLKAIYNTHSNADHIGGNRYLQSQTGCRIFAKGIECDFTNHPVLEPSFLYGGYPVKELEHKFLLAQESCCEMLTEDALPDGFEMIDLKGHFFDMTGFRTADEVVFLADCLSSEDTLDKYKIGFIYDVEAYLATLETVKALEAKLFIPSHAKATDDITELCDYNIKAVNEIADKICDTCREPLCFEQLLKKLSDDYSLTMNFQQYVLVGSTVRSYLSYLKNTGRLSAVFSDNMLLWKRT